MSTNDYIPHMYGYSETPHKEPSQNEKVLAAALYGLSLFFPIIAPLVIWLLKKDESEFIQFHATEYLNFFISIVIYSLISTILVVVGIGLLGLMAIYVFNLVFTIIAAIKSFEGQRYKIPFTIRLLNK